jgi:hypothetical protein
MWLFWLLLLLLQIHGCHCKHCKRNDASSNEAMPGGDCFTLDDAAGADLAATPFAAAAAAADLQIHCKDNDTSNEAMLTCGCSCCCCCRRSTAATASTARRATLPPTRLLPVATASPWMTLLVLTWQQLPLLLLLQIHGCHCKRCKKDDTSNEAAPGGDCFTLDDAAGADVAAADSAAAAAASSDDNKKRGWPVRLVTKYIVPPRECAFSCQLLCNMLHWYIECGYQCAAGDQVAVGFEDNKKRGWPVMLVFKYIVPYIQCYVFKVPLALRTTRTGCGQSGW